MISRRDLWHPATLALGGGSISLSQTYSSRLQPTRIQASSASGADLLDLAYDFGLGTADNGNVQAIINGRDNSRSQSFAYDALNRITLARTQATTGQNAWGQAFGYDPWGNLLTTVLTQGAAPSFSVSVNGQNQIVGYCYDAAGNLLDANACPSGNPHTYAYNAEGQMVSAVAGAYTYTYDGDGQRVMKSSGKMYWYGPNGEVLTETDLSGNLTDDYVFLGGQRLARVDATGNVDYYFSDHLGSSRVVTNASGNVLDDSDFYPFGWERPVASSSGNTYKFTGKERDAETGNDNFGARYYGSSLGRFMTPDPAGMMAVDITSPQTLNRYAYVVNNPLSFTDPLGLDCVYLNDAGTGIEKGGIDQQISSSGCGQSGGFWVEGTVTHVQIGGDAETVTLTGTTNGTDTTTATYQQATTVDVGQYLNPGPNDQGHIALGLPGQVPLGLDPKSLIQLGLAMATVGRNAVVPGAVKPQVGGQLLRMIHIPASGMQGQMLENAMAQSAQNPPMYAPLGQIGCNCGIWAQQMLGDAGINSGPPAPMPGTLMEQLQLAYPQAPQQ
ncbi:MAG: RHS repeat domain-containing protein [Terriglobia bacterium]